MSKALIPPAPQQIIPSTCTIDDVSVVLLSEGDGAFYPEPHPANVEQVACDANGTVEEDENAQLAISKDIIQMRDGVL